MEDGGAMTDKQTEEMTRRIAELIDRCARVNDCPDPYQMARWLVAFGVKLEVST